MRQLGLGWQIYYQENNGLLAESYPTNNPNAWVYGDMTVAKEASNEDLIREGKLFPYVRDISIYRCPSDEGSLSSGKRLPSIRSYSMNSFMGGRELPTPAVPSSINGYVPYFTKDADVLKPSELWVMIDEDERSINDGFFVADPTARVWYDFPSISAHRHNFTYGINFGDGHAADWRIHDPQSRDVTRASTTQPNNADLQNLAAASTLKQ